MNTRFSRFVILAVGLLVGFFVARLTLSTSEIQQSTEKNKHRFKQNSHEQAFFKEEVIKNHSPQLPRPRLDLGPRTGRLWGSITTTAGKALAGVRITGTLKLASPGLNDTALNDYLDRSRLHYEKIQASLSQCISDASGNYQLEHLLEGKYTLKAELPGWRFKKAGHFGSLKNIRINRQFNLLASRMHELIVEVRLPGGSQALRAKLKIKRSTPDPNFTYSDGTHNWTPQNNVLKLPPGQYTVLASNKDLASEEASATLSLDVGNRTPLVLDLTGRSGIRGKVILGSGFGNMHMSSLRVSYQAFEGEVPDPGTLIPNHKQTKYLRGNKVFSFYDLSEGSYIIWARTSYHGTVEASAVVQVRQGDMVSKDLFLKLDKNALTIRAQVLSPEGQPLNQVKFRSGYRSFQILKQQQQTYSILLSAHFLKQLKDKGETSFPLSVIHNSYGQQTLPVEIGGEVHVTFQPPGSLLLQIEGYQSAKHRDLVKIQLKNKNGDDHFDMHKAKIPDLKGEVTFKNLSPGEYEITIGIKSSLYKYMIALKEPVTLTSGANTHNIHMPSLHTVVLTGLGDDKWATVSTGINYDFGYGSVVCSGKISNGEFTVDDLPPGDYLLRIGSAPNLKFMAFQLPGSSTIEFKATVFNAFKLTFDNNNHALAEAGFVDGDLITAIDGQELKNRAQILALRSLHDIKVKGMNKDQNYTLSMTLYRGDVVEMDARLFATLSRLQGPIRPASRP